MTQKADILDVNWWADLVIGLLDKGEWKVLIFGLILTYAGNYILRTMYKSVWNKQNPYHVRLMAIMAGFIAAFSVWEPGAISMEWYMAGVMLGPLSIILHHVLVGIASNPPVNKFLPWLYPLIKGPGTNRRGSIRTGIENRR